MFALYTAPKLQHFVSAQPLGQQARCMATWSKETILEWAKNYKGRSRNCLKLAYMKVTRSLRMAYWSRQQKRPKWQGIFRQRITAAAQEHELRYGFFMRSLWKMNVRLSKRSLAELAVSEPFSFKALVDQVKVMRGIPIMK